MEIRTISDVSRERRTRFRSRARFTTFSRGVPDEPQLAPLIHMLPSTKKYVTGCPILSDATWQREGGTELPVDA